MVRVQILRRTCGPLRPSLEVSFLDGKDPINASYALMEIPLTRNLAYSLADVAIEAREALDAWEAKEAEVPHD